MDKEVLFTERQRFTQWWLWLILLGINVRLLFEVGEQSFREGSLSDHVILFGVSILLTLLFISLKLETQIKSDGIYVRFFPFHISFKHYPWDNISKSYVRQYRPLGEYGGWGLRRGFGGKGRALNVSGNMGLQLEFSDEKKLLIGTKKSDELTAALTRIGQLKP